MFAAAVFDFENDEALVLTDPGFRPVPRVDGRGTPDIPVADGVEQAAGSVLCKAGLTTGMTCGIILPGQGSLIYKNGSVVSNLKMTDACAADGDSGGPAYDGLGPLVIGVISWTTGPGNTEGCGDGSANQGRDDSHNEREPQRDLLLARRYHPAQNTDDQADHQSWAGWVSHCSAL